MWCYLFTADALFATNRFQFYCPHSSSHRGRHRSKPTNQPIHKPTNQSTNQPTNQPTNPQTNRPTNPQTSKQNAAPTTDFALHVLRARASSLACDKALFVLQRKEKRANKQANAYSDWRATEAATTYHHHNDYGCNSSRGVRPGIVRTRSCHTRG